MNTIARSLLILAFAATLLDARVNVVTLPARDSVQLTIYNSADLTLVKETRLLTFRKGMNRLEFSWVNTLIDPTSVEFSAVTHADDVDVLDVSFPPRVTNTLEWRIRSEFSGEVEVAITYFTSGIGWTADYVAEADTDEKQMALAGYVRVNNKSGEDYENASVRLVVGVIRLVEDIRSLATAGQPGEQLSRESKESDALQSKIVRRAMRKTAKFDVPASNREIVKEGLSEYFLYSVEGRDTILNGWSKRLPSFRTEDVPTISFYKYEKERWGDRVMRYYRFKNDKKSKLGTEPLPDGSVKAFRVVSEDGLYSFVGSTAVKYIPVDEQVDMELGSDREVMIKPVLKRWSKDDLRFTGAGNVSGWEIKEAWEIELQNSKAIPVSVDVRRNFAGDWSIESDDDYENVDATKVKFLVSLKPGEKRTLTYLLTTRHGVNIKK